MPAVPPLTLAFLVALGSAEIRTTITAWEDDLAYHSLIQRKAVTLGTAERSIDNEGNAAPGSINIDHAHLVIHCNGCEEVKAQLSVVTGQISVVNAKLAECSKRRKQLERDLREASMDRAQAELELRECGREREKLTAALAECAKERAIVEKDLAKCGIERAKLEAELKQCAEVDRPKAEADLAKCANERKALEQELAALVAKLKQGAGASKQPAAVRRRRRGGRRRRKVSTLMQAHAHTQNDNADMAETTEDDGKADHAQIEEGEDFEEESEEAKMTIKKMLSVEDEDLEEEDVEEEVPKEHVSLLDETERDRLEVRHKAIQVRLAALAKEENIFQTSIDKVWELASATGSHLNKLEAKSEELLLRMANLNQKELVSAKDLERAEENSTEILNRLDKLQTKVDETGEAMSASDEMVGVAAGDVAKMTETQIETQKELIALVQQTQHLRHEELRIAHQEAGKKVGKIEALLEEKADLLKDRHEECDQLRGKVILAKGKLDQASAALATCLQAKKDIQMKIDRVEKMRNDAKEALANCLKSKAKLKAQVEDCHRKRDTARQKLQECLERKKDLKIKIAACHEKRDEARKKLAQCLKNKKVLNEKLAKAKAALSKKTGLLQDATIEQGRVTPEELEDEDEDARNFARVTEYVMNVLETLHAANKDFDDLGKAYQDANNIMEVSVSQLNKASQEEKTILKELQATTDEEDKQQMTVADLQTELHRAYMDLRHIDEKSNEAEAASEATGQVVDEVSLSLSSLLQKLSTPGLIEIVRPGDTEK